MEKTPDNPEDLLPPHLKDVRKTARETLGEVVPAQLPLSEPESKDLMFSSRTDGGRELPPCHLVYFLLVDLLGFSDLGERGNAAWTVPIRFQGRLYAVESRDFEPGIFAPDSDPDTAADAPLSDEAEKDARRISALITEAAAAARPYFDWRAGQAASGTDLNVVNNSGWLFQRYECFRDRFHELSAEAEKRKDERVVTKGAVKDGTPFTAHHIPSVQLQKEAQWNAQAAIEAFFAWTEHMLIHISILQGRSRSGEEVRRLAEADWKTKFETALDARDPETKKHLDFLLDLHAQAENLREHGAFGRQGEAFWFCSETGVVPVFLTRGQTHGPSLEGKPVFDESEAILRIEAFVEHLWSGPREAMREYVFSGLPGILLFVADGTYDKAIKSKGLMKRLVEILAQQLCIAGDMD